MALREEFERTGEWLFRWRSYLPLLVLALIPLAILPSGPVPAGPAAQNAWELFCLGVGLLGLVVRALVIGYAPYGTSGRNVDQQIADTLNVSGMYGMVRHPLYLGNYLMWLGAVLVMRVWWVAVLMTLIYWLYYERIMFREEEFLRGKFGAAYERWSVTAPPMVPRRLAWVRPGLTFSWRNVLRREYSGLFGLIATWAFADWVDDWHGFGTLTPDSLTLTVFAAGAVVYVGLRALKKNTRLLQVEGR